jgi:hypothetical protein
MSDTIIQAKIIRNGQPHWEEVMRGRKSIVEISTAEELADFSKIATKPANACIYCDSQVDLSREHVLAFALGGITTIPKGTCKSCQKITQRFETEVLRGPMQMVRYITNIQSRTKYKGVPKTVSFRVTINGKEQKIEVPRDEAPILLAFPTFDEPTYLIDGDPTLKLNGLATGTYGVDPIEFAEKLGAESISITSSDNKPVAFARLLAKTAYANAFINGQISRLKNKSELVNAMMHEPNTLGRFVGTLPQPYLKRKVRHYLGIHELLGQRVLYSTVQLFASSGAPTYIVVLGTLRE